MSMFSLFGKIIPPPSYILLPSVGIDISDTSLKYVQFQPDKFSGTQLKLLHWGDIDIEASVLNQGVIDDQNKLSEVIREVKNRTGIESVRVSLPEERAYLFETEIKKGTSFKEVRGLLEFLLEENVPVSPRDAFFDYDIIKDDSNKSAMRVSVTVYTRETIMSYYDACIAGGVTPLSFEVEAQAIARATIPSGDKGTYIIVDFGRTRSGIGIVNNGILMYTSTIDIGGDELSAVLRNQLGDLEESELTKIKNTQGLTQSLNSSDVYEALLPVMSTIADEIKARISYWNTHNISRADNQIQSVILCGGSINMKGLPEYFSEILEVQSTRANVWRNVFSDPDTIPDIHKKYSYGYATAIGLAITPFSNI